MRKKEKESCNKGSPFCPIWLDHLIQHQIRTLITWTSEMSTLIAIRDADLNGKDGDYSPAKEKASNRGVYNGRLPLLHLRLRLLFGSAKYKLLLLLCLFSVLYMLSSFMGWKPQYSSSVSSTSRYLHHLLMCLSLIWVKMINLGICKCYKFFKIWGNVFFTQL